MKNRAFLQVAKLQAMPAGEILHRINEKLFRKRENFNYIFNVKPRSPVDENQFYTFKNHNGFFTELISKEERKSLIHKFFCVTDWLNEADLILDGKVSFLGKDFELRRETDWNEDPVLKCKWPKTFYGRVAANHPEGADIKYIWEINRHQFLIPLAKAFYITGDEKYAERVFEIIRSWIYQNPYNTGVNWTSSLEQAVRAFSWIWAIHLCKESKNLTPVEYTQFANSLYEHGLYINNHLSTYSSPYNHLIGELSALHLIGFVLNNIKECREWEERAWCILAREVANQFHEDGMTVEQGSFYHHFTLGFYLHSVMLRKKNNREVGAELLERLERALEFSMHLTRPDGEFPRIGDIDNARSLYFRQGHSWNFSGFLALGAIIFNRPDFKAVGGPLSEELLWLVDIDDIKGFEEMEERFPQERSKPFYKSGYFFSGDSWKKGSACLLFDCGEIAAGLYAGDTASAAHGHADALSFELFVHGVPFIVDGGFNTYFGELKWHKYFREEEAHNTVRVGGERQAAYAGRLTWNRVIHPSFKKWAHCEKFDYMSGFINYRSAVHTREILAIGNEFWLINDLIEINGDGESEVNSYLHFHPDVEIDVGGTDNMVVASNGEKGICLNFPKSFTLNTERGGIEPGEGWVADGYGFKKPGWRVVVSCRTRDRRAHCPVLILPWENRALVSKTPEGFSAGNNNLEFVYKSKLCVVSFSNGSLSQVTKGGEVLFDIQKIG